MGLTDKMMNGMIKALPVEEREELMLKMMPDMMKNVSMAKMIPLMLKELGRILTLYSVFSFLAALLKDEEFKAQLKKGSDTLQEKMPAMMEMMQPMMTDVMMPVKMDMMSKVMPKMMGFMHHMMPMMGEMAPQMMNDIMIPAMKDNSAMKANMLFMMQTMFPHCAENMFPLLEKEERINFTQKLYAIMAKSASGGMPVEEKRSFGDKSIQVIKEGLSSNSNEE
jgi:hypothetical protein